MAAAMESHPFGPTHCVAQPMTLARTPSRIVARPPARGEHTEEILRDIGYGAEDLAALRARDII